jgi:hypothetical protein
MRAEATVDKQTAAAKGGSDTSRAMMDFLLGHDGPYSALQDALMVDALRLSTKDCSARAASGRL